MKNLLRSHPKSTLRCPFCGRRMRMVLKCKYVICSKCDHADYIDPIDYLDMKFEGDIPF